MYAWIPVVNEAGDTDRRDSSYHLVDTLDLLVTPNAEETNEYPAPDVQASMDAKQADE